MKIELLNADGEVVTQVETNGPAAEFEYFKTMLPEIVSWQEQAEPLDEARTKYMKAAGAEFARRRDAITWTQHETGLYGYDRKSDDVTNFLAAMKRAELGLDTGFNVYVGNVGHKQFLPHTYEMFNVVLEQSANEQIAAYQWYEGIKGRLNAATTSEELETIYPLKTY